MRQTRITKTTPRRRKGETDKREREERRLALVPSLSFLLLFCLCKLWCVQKNATFARERKQRKREGNKTITCKPKILIEQGRAQGEWPFLLLLLLRVHTIKEDKTGRERGKERERMTTRGSLSLLLQRRKSKRRLRPLSRRKRDTKRKKLLPPPLLPHPKS